jgi:hypothetical protein
LQSHLTWDWLRQSFIRDPPVPLGAFLRRILFYAPGTAEPIGYSPAELVVYEFELNLSAMRTPGGAGG